MLNKILGRLYSLIFQRKISKAMLNPPTDNEKHLISSIRKLFMDIPHTPIENLSAAALSWANNMNRLKELVLTNDPRGFLNWDVIRRTMIFGNSAHVRKEYAFLKSRIDFKRKWYPAIKESDIGSPDRYKYLAKSSGNLIHHAYHLAQFEETTNFSVVDTNIVFEFGGGYGSMCRLFYNLGYKKKYIIFDLAPFSALQEYYLKSSGFHILGIDNFLQEQSGILCLSKIDDLVAILGKLSIEQSNSLFIATWSISETPENIRESVLPHVKDFSSYLIAYQDKFGEVDNISYFEKFKDQHRNILWSDWAIPHLPGNNYLIGK